MEFPITFTLNYNDYNVIINCKEVEVPNTTYSKVITLDGNVAVLYSDKIGGGWSTDASKSIQQQLIFDSRIVLYVLSEEFQGCKTKNQGQYKSDMQYPEFIKSILGLHNIHCLSGFSNLSVKFIPKDTLFRINVYDGLESVEVLDIQKYFTA